MVLRGTRKLVLSCLFIALSALVIVITHMIQINPFLLYNQSARTRPVTSEEMTTRPVSSEEMTTKEAPDTSITLFVRMSGKRPDHRQRYLCNVLRTAVLFWPPSLGNLVIALDEESQEDHEFAERLKPKLKNTFLIVKYNSFMCLFQKTRYAGV